MSSLHILIVYTILTIIIADKKNIYFTQSIYDIWCQENILSNSLFLYPNRIPIGIYHRSNIKSVVYHLIDDNNNDLFSVKTKHLIDFYFCILNITRPLDINREYQDIYELHIQANIITNQGNFTEQAKIYLHVADSNDNDAVFDVDIYEKTISESLEIPQLLIRFHASDADEIHHAQILYELSSLVFNDTFSLHPFTGELYLISKKNLQLIYEFDIYAYDRHRKYLINNKNIKTKVHVKLIFPEDKISNYLTTIFNEIIEFKQIISSYKIEYFQNLNWNILNIHQPILTIDIDPIISSFEIFILNNSSLNSMNLFIYKNKIYLNNSSFQEYNLHFLICFSNRIKCQYTNYILTPSIDLNLFKFSFKSIQPIFIQENLPIYSFLTNIQLEYNHLISNQQLIINYILLNNHNQFNLHSKTGILRLGKQLKYSKYILEIQANIYLFNKSSSIKTNIEINICEINKYRPIFSNNTLRELFQLPYQFQAFDFDENKQTNGRIIYRLWNCFNNCPFEINPINGILNLIKKNDFIKKNIYYLQIIAFDLGEPISFETSIDIKINLSSRLIKRDLIYKSIIPEESIYSSTHSKTIYLNIGFKENSTFYHLYENAKIHTIIDDLNIEYDSFPLFINNEKDNIFFYIINDTSIPFAIDQNEKKLKLINFLDREKQDKYIFEIELKLKSSYVIKLQEIYQSKQKNISFNFRYSNKYYQKILFNIYINDINDNIPICNYFHKKIYVNENQIQTNIFHVQAFDPDLGENGTIIYSLLDYNQYFTINSYTGQINSIQPIDHEQISYLLLHIITSDQGQQLQLQSLCMTLHIIIVDINDNIPQFSLENYVFHIFSDLPQETIFGQIYAIDADSIDNLIYSIDSNPYIKINKDTGHLRLKSNLHHLINQNLNITIKVSDSLHTNQTWIYIHIKPFLDAQQPILLSEPAYNIIINQSLPIGTIITNIYHHLEILKSSIDFIEIINEENIIPFSIDQQGSIRLIHLLTNSSYWISIRLTRYRAHPPHSFIHIHLTIREDNFYLPQCINIYQSIKIYDYSNSYSLIRVQALSLYDNINLQYSIINNNITEKIFSIDKQTGFIKFNHLIKSDYLLTIQALDNQHQLSIDCYLKINYIQRRELIPKFFYSSIYNIDLIEISSNSKRLRQRLFQVIALLDQKIYNKNLQIRYRIIDSNQYFIINRQTGYIATKKPLYPHKIYQFNVEAFTVVYRGKWRIISSRVKLSIKVRVLPINITNSSLLLTNQSIIRIDLLTTTKVGSTLLKLGINKNNYTQWFIMIGQIEYTRYFHVNFQTGELILIRPIEELINKTTIIELHINVTNDWIYMNTIKVIIHIKNTKFSLSHFSQTDYYSSISKTIPIGIEIARLNVENSMNNCTYNIHSVERIKSQNFFHIDPYSGSITIIQSLENSLNDKHLLTIIYYCQLNFHIVYTRLHINIFDKKYLKNQINNSYRFSQENYLIIFETSLIKYQKKYLINLELINNDYQNKRIKPDAQIVEGDPLGLFSIDSSNQSLFLLDESRSRSYIYPIQLTIIDTSQKEPINCTITLFITNIAIQFTCPSHLNPSPYLLTYESVPRNSIDLFTGQQYNDYNSLTIRGFDSFIPSNFAECFMINSSIKFSNKKFDFIFEKDIYDVYINSFHYEPIHLSIKNRNNYSNPFDITYQFINQNSLNSFQLDKYSGIIKYIPKENSFLILAKYQSLITFTRLNIFFNNSKQSIDKFQLSKTFNNNYTIGYLNEKKSIQCSLNRFYFSEDNQLIGYIEILNLRKKSFYLLNYNHLFILDHQNGLLYHRNKNQIIQNDLRLLIEIENSRCSITINGISSIPYIMIRKENKLQMEFEKLMDIKRSSGQIKLQNGTLINFDIVSNQAPIFFQKSYTFSLNITNNPNKRIFVGQISAQPYNINRSYIVYQFISLTKYFIINPDNGIIEYIPNRLYNKTIEQFQILVRDLIYQQNTTINITINIFKSEFISFSPLIYYQTISEILPPGSIIFQPNISSRQNLQYSLQNSNLFTIDLNTGQVTLLNYLSDSFYSLYIHVFPINRILIIKLTILDYNNHSPIFINLPLNLTISSDDTFVTKLSAYDLDLSDNENLKYYLLDQDQQKIFSINQKSGIITLKTPTIQTFFQLKIGISDGVYLTTENLSITIYNYSKNSPKFSSNEYVFEYNQILGQISANDSDLSDRIIYELYLEPDGIQIDQYSGLITINKTLFPQTIEFFASASDRAKQIIYTKIQIVFPIQPKFTSNLYYISLISSIKIPSEIFHFELVDLFNQSLLSTRFEIDQTNFFEINQNKLILKEKLPLLKIFYFNIYGYWKKITCQTSIQIMSVENKIKLNKNFYEFSIEKNLLKTNYFIQKFDIKNSLFKILSTPLTINNCVENFYLKNNELYFKTYPILSNLCFFEIQLTNQISISSSQIKILFIDPDFLPKFSSKNFYFYTNHIRIFAKSSNTIRYKLQTNPYGLIINQTNGIISFKYNFDRIKNLNQIQLFVYAIDEKTNFNDTALIHIIPNRKKLFKIPTEIASCPNTPVSISDQSLPGTIIQDIHVTNNNSNYYYILSGDKYGLFAINNLGKLYLISSILNRTSDEYFELIILISSLSISYCRTNISIIRSPKWSYFICPIIPIEWMIEEESPIGTRIGNIKDILLMINNNSQLIDRLHMKLNPNNDTQAFHLNSSTGLIFSKSRLDYEQKDFYSFSILFESNEFNCSLLILIKLININDNSIFLDKKSLIYTINKNNHFPFYIGRINLIDLDQLFSFEYKYYLKNPSSDISIDSTTGSIILLTKLDREIHEEIIVIDYSNQKNFTDILIINLNDQSSEFLKENSTTFLYLFYPLINTIIYKYQSNLTYEIINNTYSNYFLRISSNLTELILNKSILNNHEDNLIIRIWNNEIVFSDINLRLIYLQYEIKYPKILSQIIDGYINFEENSLIINLGQLFIENHSQYQFIYFNLISNKDIFFLKQLSNNQTELYFKFFHQTFFQKFQIDLITIALSDPIPDIDFSTNTKIFFPSKIKSQSIDIHLWSINHEMLDRTVSLIINKTSNITYEQFIIYNLPLIRQTLARILDINIQYVHIYTFELKENQIELLIAILRSTSQRYLHKKFIYNALKNSKNIFEKILFNQCQLNSCENNAFCTSYINLLLNQYEYFYLNTYQRLIPKYQWNTKCLCTNSYYGERCQFKQNRFSPCSSNPCLSIEKCIELNSTLYSCQCRDDLCNIKNSFQCININSPTCRDSSNALTFDGDSSIRMNLTINSTQSITIRLSFRTHLTEGKLLKLIYFNEKIHLIILEIIDGYIKIEFNKKILLQLNYILINDNLWHDIYFLIDYSHFYYHLRLDNVFSDKIILSKQIHLNNHIQLIIGTDFHGCLSNLSLNNQLIYFQKQNNNNNSIEFIGTNNGCQLLEIINDDLCSLYNPCYHGGICINHEELNFSCNCSSSRFIGRQCQLDLYPCESHPCQLNEQCISLSFYSKKLFTCIPLLISTKKSLYIGLILIFSLCSLLGLFIYYYKKRKDKSFVSAPLLIHKSSTIINQTDSTMETLLKSDYHKKQSYDSLCNDRKYCSTTEQMNNNSIDYVSSSSSSQYFNNSDNQRTHRIYVNSSMNLTENNLFNHNHILTSTLSLPKVPLYARIVKTPKINNTIDHLSSNSTSFIRVIKTDNDKTNGLTMNRLRHASDSDLLDGKKSNKFSSFFQTDV